MFFTVAISITIIEKKISIPYIQTKVPMGNQFANWWINFLCINKTIYHINQHVCST